MENNPGVPEKVKQSYCMTQEFHSYVYIQEIKMSVHTKTCIQMFTVEIVMTAKKKHTKCPQMSTYWWMNKCTSSNGILFGNKKEWCTGGCYNMDELKHFAKKPDTKGHIYVYMKCPEKANLYRQKVD